MYLNSYNYIRTDIYNGDILYIFGCGTMSAAFATFTPHLTHDNKSEQQSYSTADLGQNCHNLEKQSHLSHTDTRTHSADCTQEAFKGSQGRKEETCRQTKNGIL